MKDSTLQALITARTLLEQAEKHCASGDRYAATAGIIVLQDAVELVLLAVMREMGLDEHKALESLTFDQMIGELSAAKVVVPKSGTLKAMNKLRVTAKHYGQLMEPVTVQVHLNTAKQALDAVLQSVVGKPLRDIYLTELIPAGEVRTLLESASVLLSQSQFMNALVMTRRAFFIEFERGYCIYDYRDLEANKLIAPRGFGLRMCKAPYWTQNRDWIDKNVRTPFDFIQMDYDRIKLDAMEWGINTQTLHNIRRLTPQVVRLESDGNWYTKYSAAFPSNSATKENTSYCLDTAIDVIRRKRDHQDAIRVPSRDKPFDYPLAYVGQPQYIRPELGSPVTRNLQTADRYVVKEVLHGFDKDLTFYRIDCTDSDGRSFDGYVEKLREPLEGATGSV